MKESIKQKISRTHKKLGTKPPSNLGKKFSEEHKRRLSESHKNIKHSKETEKVAKSEEEIKKRIMKKEERIIKAWAITGKDGELIKSFPRFIPSGLLVFLTTPKRNQYLTIAKWNEGGKINPIEIIIKN